MPPASPFPITARMNSITLVGRAAAAPTIRYYDSGAVRATVTLLVQRRNDSPDRFPLELWGKQAQLAADTVRTGGLLGVTGRLRQDLPDDLAGSPFFVRVEGLELLSPPQASEAADA